MLAGFWLASEAFVLDNRAGVITLVAISALAGVANAQSVAHSRKTLPQDARFCPSWAEADHTRSLAQICGEYLHKGKMVYVEGSLQTRSWEDQDGKKMALTTRTDGVKQVWLQDPDGYWIEINDAR